MFKVFHTTNGIGQVKSIKALGIAAGLLIVGMPALGSETASLELSIEGKIPKRCSFVENGSPTMIVKSTGTTGNFVVDCNTPFEYSMKSANGALLHSLSAEQIPNSAFKRKIPYEVNVVIPLDQSTKPEINDSCLSMTINNPSECELSNSGSGIAINRRGSLTLRPILNANDLYLAGGYTDTLTIGVKASH